MLVPQLTAASPASPDLSTTSDTVGLLTSPAWLMALHRRVPHSENAHAPLATRRLYTPVVATDAPPPGALVLTLVTADDLQAHQNCRPSPRLHPVLANNPALSSEVSIGLQDTDEYIAQDLQEPLMDPALDRPTFNHAPYQDLFDQYKKSQACFWTVEEIDMPRDHIQFHMLSSAEQLFLRQVLAFFAFADQLVTNNLVEHFYQDIQVPAAKAFFAMQIVMETIHQETHLQLLQVLFPASAMREALIAGVPNMSGINDKLEWTETWCLLDATLAEQLIAFICVEGIFFSSSFCTIFWAKFMHPGKLSSLTLSN